jgi:hypothetical protein
MAANKHVAHQLALARAKRQTPQSQDRQCLRKHKQHRSHSALTHICRTPRLHIETPCGKYHHKGAGLLDTAAVLGIEKWVVFWILDCFSASNSLGTSFRWLGELFGFSLSRHLRSQSLSSSSSREI